MRAVQCSLQLVSHIHAQTQRLQAGIIKLQAYTACALRDSYIFTAYLAALGMLHPAAPSVTLAAARQQPEHHTAVESLADLDPASARMQLEGPGHTQSDLHQGQSPSWKQVFTRLCKQHLRCPGVDIAYCVPPCTALAVATYSHEAASAYCCCCSLAADPWYVG